MCWKVLGARRGALKGKTIQRVVFNAITKQAVLDAMAKPRDVDQPLVEAYLAAARSTISSASRCRRCCVAKLPGARSAGRVQSVALRLVCDRENEIEVFKPQEYWSLIARSPTRRADEFRSAPVRVEGA